jgi:hypothetical protein
LLHAVLPAGGRIPGRTGDGEAAGRGHERAVAGAQPDADAGATADPDPGRRGPDSGRRSRRGELRRRRRPYAHRATSHPRSITVVQLRTRRGPSRHSRWLTVRAPATRVPAA